MGAQMSIKELRKYDCIQKVNEFESKTLCKKTEYEQYDCLKYLHDLIG